jgi:uncharacterized protein (TIGR02453 family)
MNDAPGLSKVLTYLKRLRNNNDKPWFDANRPLYDEARAIFERFIGAAILRFGEFEDLGGVEPKECIFRIYRDIRFSANKLPYKSVMSAVVGPGGKSSSTYSHYIHIAPENESFIAGGIHMPTSEEITRFRTSINRNPARFNRILAGREFKRCFDGLTGDKLKTVPRGFSKDHPHIELLRMKEVLALHRWTDQEVASPRFLTQMAGAARAMMPFLEYLNREVRG